MGRARTRVGGSTDALSSGARGKWRGFSPGAAARPLEGTRVMRNAVWGECHGQGGPRGDTPLPWHSRPITLPSYPGFPSEKTLTWPITGQQTKLWCDSESTLSRIVLNRTWKEQLFNRTDPSCCQMIYIHMYMYTYIYIYVYLSLSLVLSLSFCLPSLCLFLSLSLALSLFNRTDTTCRQIKMGMVAYLCGDHHMFSKTDMTCQQFNLGMVAYLGAV